MDSLFEGLEEKIPYHLPTCGDFGTALSLIKVPLVAFERAVLAMEEVAGLKADKGLIAIGNMISLFLEQLDYLVENSQIDGHSIGGADVIHPFEIRVNPTKEAGESETEAQNA